MTKQELIQAAKAIKKYCQHNKNCNCPFSDNAGICRLGGDLPADWRVSTWADWDLSEWEREANDDR